MTTVPTHPAADPIDPRDVPVLVDLARRVLPPARGLDGFVAVNPLDGFEHLPFESAVDRATDLFGTSVLAPPSWYGDRVRSGALTADHVQASLAELGIGGDADGLVRTVAHLPGPGSHRGPAPTTAARPATTEDPPSPATELLRRGTGEVAPLVDRLVAHWCATAEPRTFAAWRAVARRDPDLRRWSARQARATIDAFPASATETIATLLGALGIDRAHATPYLEAQLARLPGWAIAIGRAAGSSGLVDYLAVRLATERLLLDSPHRPVPHAVGAERDALDELASLDDVTGRLVWQGAAELAWRDGLLDRLTTPDARPAPIADRSNGVAAQVACCIDVRSEPLRRHLEAIGPYETFGIAGFFGLPIAVQGHGDEHPVPSCPVIVDPRATVQEQPRRGGAVDPRDRDVPHRAFHGAEVSGPSAFALADASGWLLGLHSLANAVAPDLSARFRTWRSGRGATTAFELDQHEDRPGRGLTLETQVALARGALTAIGLTDGFAPVIVLCGHRSDHRNNPFRAGLDCGACGGRPGGPNARILAAICNRPAVRAQLAAEGIHIPDGTWFVPAEHETTDDEVVLLDTVDVPPVHRAAVEAVAADLARAAAAAAAERAERLPAPPRAKGGTGRRSADPAQVVPDWGLVRCAAIVVGPRSLTAGLDLDRRTFLHSYAPAADPDGVVLEAIMTGPVVVAHWIASQYSLSTAAPERFGAGPKPLQNVIGRDGVATADGLDLRIGLPLESTWFDGRPIHEPMRLLVVVDAPAARVEGVIARNPVLQRLFDHGWARVVARAEDGDGFAARDRAGRWIDQPVAATGDETTAAPHDQPAHEVTPTH
jgi:uncharacterized protein YbcC (UPF0753/DUF2309 family)